jgi:cell division protein YceG involved in septum cleavage
MIARFGGAWNIIQLIQEAYKSSSLISDVTIQRSMLLRTSKSVHLNGWLWPRTKHFTMQNRKINALSTMLKSDSE